MALRCARCAAGDPEELGEGAIEAEMQKTGDVEAAGRPVAYQHSAADTTHGRLAIVGSLRSQAAFDQQWFSSRFARRRCAKEGANHVYARLYKGGF